ncbi:uncharacterized protein LOC130682304 [Manis pentadactyla]|uniref:uncharacterized protein LOC130682304 n=1 Tax=Manis pentadactyla TaxID=143292 RepID=UPI00255C95D5|nr:uncharacterized protein LOC130682304 [Manis pentadactyla]
MRERLRGAGSHWARAQKTYLRRLRSSCRRRSPYIEESVGSPAPPGGTAPAAQSVLRTAVRVRALRPSRAANPAEPRWWTRAVLGYASLPAPRRQRRLPRPLGPRRRTRRFATLPRRTEGGDRLARRAAATAVPAPVQVGRLQPGAVARRDQEPRCGRGACGRLSPADRFAKAAESPAGKRLRPPGTCGGASRAGPASGVKATATALWAPSFIPLWCEKLHRFWGLVRDNFGGSLHLGCIRLCRENCYLDGSCCIWQVNHYHPSQSERVCMQQVGLCLWASMPTQPSHTAILWGSDLSAATTPASALLSCSLAVAAVSPCHPEHWVELFL